MAKQILLIFLIPLVLVGCNSSIPTQIKDECVEINNQFPPSVHLVGNLVITGKNTYLFNGENQTQQPLPVDNLEQEVRLSNFKISPDHRQMVYEERSYDQSGLTDKNVKLFQNNGTSRKVDAQSSYGSLITWFDNDRLLFVPEGQTQGTIILLNSQTNQVEEIIGSFQNMYTLAPLPSWYGSFSPLPIYDPSLSLALYLRQGEGMEYSLWDAKSKHSLWEKHVVDPSSQPQWSPSGDQIVFAIPEDQSGFDFFSVDRDGHENRLTDISVTYRFVYIGSFSWSPNGQYIAFWLDARNNESDFAPKLALFDIQQNEIINYCLGAGGRKPVWSPDGKQIAVEIRQDDISPTTTVILDIETQYAVAIDNQVYPVGWLR